MNSNLKTIWEHKLRKALAADREAVLQKTASRLMKMLNQLPRQWMVYDLVCNWGIPERVVGEKLGLTQQFVSRILAKILEKYPGLRPTPDCRIKGQKRLPAGFHLPGKTRLSCK